MAQQDEVAAAEPEIDKRTEQMVSNGKWMPAGYQVYHNASCYAFHLLTLITGKIWQSFRALIVPLCIAELEQPPTSYVQFIESIWYQLFERAAV